MFCYKRHTFLNLTKWTSGPPTCDNTCIFSLICGVSFKVSGSFSVVLNSDRVDSARNSDPLRSPRMLWQPISNDVTPSWSSRICRPVSDGNFDRMLRAQVIDESVFADWTPSAVCQNAFYSVQTHDLLRNSGYLSVATASLRTKNRRPERTEGRRKSTKEDGAKKRYRIKR